MDWTPLLGYLAKAAGLVKKAVDDLAVEREIVVPESVLNTALAAFARRSPNLHALGFELFDDWFDVDLVCVWEGVELGLNASFQVQAITLDHHKQSVVLQERRKLAIQPRRFPSAWHKLRFLAWVWWCRRVRGVEPLAQALNQVEGVSIRDGVYRLDFSPWLRRKPALIASLYALDIQEVRIVHGGIYLRGAADLQSLNLVKELYKLLPASAAAEPPAAPTSPDRRQAEAEADAFVDKLLARQREPQR